MILDRMTNSYSVIVLWLFCCVLHAVAVTDVGSERVAGVSMSDAIPMIPAGGVGTIAFTPDRWCRY